MKYTLLVLFLAGCTTTYEPQTRAGAQCKLNCSTSTDGARSYNRCIEACRDLDRLSTR